MYGAIADGTTDCTAAIQNAVNSGKNVWFPAGKYKMAGTVTIASTSSTSAKQYIEFDASGAVITYTGDSYAFELIKLTNCWFWFGAINATGGGGCIFFNATGVGINQNYDYSAIGDNWTTTYVDIYFKKFKTTNDEGYCIRAEQKTVNGTVNYVNEIRINNGRFERGNAIYLKQNTKGASPCLTTWRLTRVSFEGYVSGDVRHEVGGLRYDCASASTVKKGFSFIDCRSNECISYAMDFSSDGYDCAVQKILWVSVANCLTQYFRLTSRSSGVIIGPIFSSSSSYLSNSARIVNGYIVPNDFGHMNWTGYSNHQIDLSDKTPEEFYDTIVINSGDSTQTDTIILPKYYGVNNGGLNDIYFIFYHNHTKFEVYIDGNNTPVLTFDNIVADASSDPPVYRVIRARYSSDGWRYWVENEEQQEITIDTAISSSSTDDNVPSSKCVFDNIKANTVQYIDGTITQLVGSPNETFILSNSKQVYSIYTAYHSLMGIDHVVFLRDGDNNCYLVDKCVQSGASMTVNAHRIEKTNSGTNVVLIEADSVYPNATQLNVYRYPVNGSGNIVETLTWDAGLVANKISHSYNQLKEFLLNGQTVVLPIEDQGNNIVHQYILSLVAFNSDNNEYYSGFLTPDGYQMAFIAPSPDEVMYEQGVS